ncbi:MAG: hypothetical protein WCF33_10325 [Pseudonocardiaceae bacterium]
MPNIRVMQWNIRKFGAPKAAVTGMLRAISQTIVGANVDIVVIVELVGKTGPAALASLAADLRVINAANHWAFTYSAKTGNERYGFLIRNLTTVRPTQITPNPNAPGPALGIPTNPLKNLDSVRFMTWPANWPTAYPPAAALPAPPPLQPLIGLFAAPRLARQAKKANFGGQPLALGGYAQGNGGRLPCLALFHINTGGGHYYLPILVCHFFATRSCHATNAGAITQIQQMKLTHIAQKFAFQDQTVIGAPPVSSGYLDIDNAPVRVQELMVTGDWNLDFQQNQFGGTPLESLNHGAFVTLTPTPQRGGSAPPIVPGVGAVMGPAPAPAPPPAVPFAAPLTAPSSISAIPNQALASAVTSQGTILLEYTLTNGNAINTAGTTQAMRDCGYDLTFYGGTQLNQAAMLTPMSVPPQAGLVVDVPASVVPTAGGVLAPGQIDLGPVQATYAIHAKYNSALAPNLNVTGAALTLQDRWIGANMVSDHVPTVVEFPCP